MTNDEQKRALMYAAGDLTEEQILSAAAKIRGRRGGMAGVGKAKSRTSEQARAAANAGWKNRRRKNEKVATDQATMDGKASSKP